MPSKNILIIEDEPGIADSVIYALKLEGFATQWETLGQSGIEALNQGEFDLLVLDIGLPDISGLEVCKLIRKTMDIPIIFLTARGDEIDRIVGLEIGGDDYMVKPFSPRELAVRVKAILRRSETLQNTAGNKTGLIIDRDKRQVIYCGNNLPLTKYEYEILLVLAKVPQRVYSREQLMTAVWNDPAESFDRAVDTHIKTLRAKFREISSGTDPITTHRGIGYSFNSEVHDF